MNRDCKDDCDCVQCENEMEAQRIEFNKWLLEQNPDANICIVCREYERGNYFDNTLCKGCFYSAYNNC